MKIRKISRKYLLEEEKNGMKMMIGYLKRKGYKKIKIWTLVDLYFAGRQGMLNRKYLYNFVIECLEEMSIKYDYKFAYLGGVEK